MFWFSKLFQAVYQIILFFRLAMASVAIQCLERVMWRSAVNRLHKLQLPSIHNLTCTYCTKPSNPRYSVVKPGNVSPIRQVPNSITKPPYGATNSFASLKNFIPWSKNIEIKTEKQIQGMQDAGQLAAKLLTIAVDSVCPGMTTDELDILVHEECVKHNAYPSPLLYKNFPKSVCTSVNNVCCHGIPDDRPLQDGDIVNIDITVSIQYLQKISCRIYQKSQIYTKVL